MPILSVLMTVYNAAFFLDESISSILNQTFSDFEFFILDDGSTDDSIKIIRSYAKQDKRIKILVNKENKGEAKSRNILLKKCKTEFAAIMDADDISVKNRFQVQLNYLKKHPEIDILGAEVQFFGSDIVTLLYTNKPKSDLFIKSHLLFNIPFCNPVVMLRMGKIKNVFYDTSLPSAVDYQYWVDCCPFVHFDNLPQVLVKYRSHKGQDSVANREKQKQSITKIIRRHLARLGFKGSTELLEKKISCFNNDDTTNLLKLIEYLLSLKPFYQYQKLDYKVTFYNLFSYINDIEEHYRKNGFCKFTYENIKKIIKELVSLKLLPNTAREVVFKFVKDILYQNWFNFDKTKLSKEVLAKELQFIDELAQTNPIYTKEKLLEIFGRAMIRKGSLKEKLKFFRNCGISKKTIFKIAFKRILKKIKQAK